MVKVPRVMSCYPIILSSPNWFYEFGPFRTNFDPLPLGEEGYSQVFLTERKKPKKCGATPKRFFPGFSRDGVLPTSLVGDTGVIFSGICFFSLPIPAAGTTNYNQA